ncbi:hypothetical protein PILCRDRAFT_16430 [Piloderma croceum F 1598]|uniref:Uncharacterized protein n=1 Tax=Piloderma croceum (strain F 1598) TaxID=765440 RepID=A0A0C3B4C2_PILCF|nr:hypothetical protein PILCRDRAFT_16430 [Piloderma croceum F 1598]
MTTITLHNIALKLLPSSNFALPRDLQPVAKVVTGGNVVAESNTMSPGSENLWMLKVKSELPTDCASFSIEIAGLSHVQAKSFGLESVRITVNKIIAMADNKQRCSRCLDVKSVDGVLSFQLRAGFSVGSIQSEP